jgi:hypothetical protein
LNPVSSSSSRGSQQLESEGVTSLNSDPELRREIPGRKTLNNSTSQGLVATRHPTRSPVLPPAPIPAPDAPLETALTPEESVAKLKPALVARLSHELPINELNVASVTARVQAVFVEDELALLEEKVTASEEAIERIQPQLEAIGIRTQNITNTANVVIAKLDALDEEIDRNGSVTFYLSAEIVNVLMSLFSVLSTLLLLLWNRIGRKPGQ